jgi:hypothetical protein
VADWWLSYSYIYIYFRTHKTGNVSSKPEHRGSLRLAWTVNKYQGIFSLILLSNTQCVKRRCGRSYEACYFFRKFFFSTAKQPPRGPRPPIIEVSRLHSLTHHTQQDSSGRVIRPTHIPLSDNKQNSQETDTHAPGGIRTRNPSKRAAADTRLRRRGQWDRCS